MLFLDVSSKKSLIETEQQTEELAGIEQVSFVIGKSFWNEHNKKVVLLLLSETPCSVNIGTGILFMEHYLLDADVQIGFEIRI